MSSVRDGFLDGVAGARCVVLNLDDVLHWSPIPEMHEEVADVKRVRCSGSTSGPNCSMTHAFCPLMTHDGCGQASKLLYRTSGGWSLVEPQTTASPGSFFCCSFGTCGSYQTVSAEGGFHFESDVSPLLFNAVAAQVEHDAQIGNTRV